MSFLAPLPLLIGPLGPTEMIIILMVALIVFGPRKLPQIGKTLGKSLGEFRRTSRELRSTLEREVQMEEFRDARNEVSGLGKDIKEGLDPRSGPTTPTSKPPSSGPAKPASPKPEAKASEPEATASSDSADDAGDEASASEDKASDTASGKRNDD